MPEFRLNEGSAGPSLRQSRRHSHRVRDGRNTTANHRNNLRRYEMQSSRGFQPFLAI